MDDSVLPLRIGIVGLDTSHVEAFADILNMPTHPHHVPGGKIVAAFPGGSPDLDFSYSRVPGYTSILQEKHGVKIVDSPEMVAEQSDAILLESVDGRVHLELFKGLVSFGKPVFIDKPLAVSTEDCREIAALSKEHGTPLLSCSALRYCTALVSALADDENGAIVGADFFGPLEIQPSMPGFFWYGIHSAEMLFATLGSGCTEVKVSTSTDHDLAVGLWKDGRIGSIRGNRKGNFTFGGIIHREKASSFVDVAKCSKPFYASLVEKIMDFLRNKRSPLEIAESIEVIRFLEAANESRDSGRAITL